jgi:DNA-binding CsgD family transcriptional regulator
MGLGAAFEYQWAAPIREPSYGDGFYLVTFFGAGMATGKARTKRANGGIDADALPAVFKIACREGDVALEPPLNAAARRLELTEPLRRALCRIAEASTTAGRWQADCITSGGVTWLAIVAPIDGATAQAVLLPMTIDSDPERLDELAPGLTPREREVLSLALRGRSPRDSSTRLGISWHTVRTHLKNAYRALGVSGRAEAVTVVIDAARPRVLLRLITGDEPSGKGRRPRGS